MVKVRLDTDKLEGLQKKAAWPAMLAEKVCADLAGLFRQRQRFRGVSPRNSEVVQDVIERHAAEYETRGRSSQPVILECLNRLLQDELH